MIYLPRQKSTDCQWLSSCFWARLMPYHFAAIPVGFLLQSHVLHPFFYPLQYLVNKFISSPIMWSILIMQFDTGMCWKRGLAVHPMILAGGSPALYSPQCYHKFYWSVQVPKGSLLVVLQDSTGSLSLHHVHQVVDIISWYQKISNYFLLGSGAHHLGTCQCLLPL